MQRQTWAQRGAVWALAGVLVVGVACSDDGADGDGANTNAATADAGDAGEGADTGGDAGAPDAAPDAVSDDAGDGDASANNSSANNSSGPAPGVCDPLIPSVCALPWPSNVYLAPDDRRETGVTLTFQPESLPGNDRGSVWDPAPYTRLDGYGVGSSILVHFPNLDLSGLASELDMAPSMAPDASILLFEHTDDGQARRIPYWVEADMLEDDPARRTVWVRPAVILREATRYTVAMRGLTTTDGQPIAASDAFARLRAGDTAQDPALAPRQARFDATFAFLDAQGVDLDALQLAWDFTTASSSALHGPMLHMRDDAFARVGPQGPELTVTEVETFSPEEDAEVAMRVRGTFRVPHYMQPTTRNGYAGFVFNLGPDGLPMADGEREARFWALVPRSALDGTPHGLVQYGHGLLGAGSEVFSGYNARIAFDHNLIFFACSLTGMSDDDLPAAVGSAQDWASFPMLADRLHQGMLEFLLLGRAFRERFASLDAVRDSGVVVDPARFHYSGISQGGIFGATYVALSPDVHRGHLGVPGNNYSILLQRSVDFDPFLAATNIFYNDRTIDHNIMLAAIENLWEGTEPVSYLRHVSAEPFDPDAPPKRLLFAPAKGDYQVSPLTLEIAARTEGLGIRLMSGYGRAIYGAPEASFPRAGSGVVLYDYGNPWPPPGNIPPDDGLGDPHGKPRRADHHNRQMVEFFDSGEIIDVCGGDGCTPE